MDITDYLRSIGFKPVNQTDELGWFTDPTYLHREGLFIELHDDNQFYVWYNVTDPIIDIKLTEENYFETRLKIQTITTTFETPITV